MSRRRTARLNEQLKRELSGLLARKVRDPRITGVIVTEVRVTSDLALARVYYRPPPEASGSAGVEEGLHAAAGFLRKELGGLLHIRRVPELRFLHDDSLDSALRIEAILKELGGEEDPG